MTLTVIEPTTTNHNNAVTAAAEMAANIAHHIAGDTLAAHTLAASHLDTWITEHHGTTNIHTVDGILDALNNLRWLEAGNDPLVMAPDGWTGTALDALDLLTRQNLTDLQYNLAQIVWAR